MRRRDFLQIGGLGVMSALASMTTGYRGFSEEMADKTLKVGLIGTGWYGKSDLLKVLQVAPVNVVALCDVNRQHLEAAGELTAARQVSKKVPKLYEDWREMLDSEQFDLMLVDTPDHQHALPGIEVMRRGIDLFVQKPIGVDVAECQALVRTARETGRVCQVGLQRRGTHHLIDMKEKIIDSGRLGQVVQVSIYTYYGMGDIFQDPCDPPEWLNYDLWTGPAPMRPFYPMVADRMWRSFFEYGNGTLGDMGVHMFDMARWLLGLGWPKRITSVGGRYVFTKGIQNIPDTQTVIFDYENLQVIWNHRWAGRLPDERHPWGAYLYGTEGTLKASVFGWDFLPKDRSKPTESGEVLYEYDLFPEDENEDPSLHIEKHTSEGMRKLMRDFIRQHEERGKCISDIEEGAISTACCVLGNVSMNLGEALSYDIATGQTDSQAANALLARPYREGWTHPEGGPF